MRALTPHIGAYLELEGGDRLGIRTARPVTDEETGEEAIESPAPGSCAPTAGGCCSGPPTGRCGSTWFSRPAGGRCRRRTTCAATPSRRARLERLSPEVTPPRARRVRGSAARLRARRLGRPRAAGGDRAPRPRGPRARPGPAPRLRCGPAPGHLGSPRRAARRAPVARTSTPASSRRCGSASSSSSSRARRPTTPPSARPSSSRRAATPARAAGLVNAVLRRAARERDDLLASLDDSTPAGAAIAHSHPPWLAEMWWDELGPGDACSADGRRQRAARDRASRQPPARRPGRRSSRSSPPRAPRVDRPSGPGPAPPESLVVDGPLAEPVIEAIEAGRVVPQSRASAAAVAALDPRPGERVLDLCAGPGDQGDPDRGADAEHGGGCLGRARRAACRTGGRAERPARGRHRAGRRRADARDAHGGGYDRVLVDPPCSDLGTLASRPDARWRKCPEQIGELAALQREILASAPARAARPAARSSTRPARSRERENEAVVAACRGLEARRAEPLRTRPGPRRDRRASSSPGCAGRADGGRSALANEIKRPVCPGCGEPWLRPTQLPGRYRCVFCLRASSSSRSAPTAASTRRSPA